MSLIVVKAQEKDLSVIIEMENDPENSRFILPYELSQHREVLLSSDEEHLLFFDSSEKLVGFAILSGLKNPNKSIEFRRIVISDKGKGYGRAAIRYIKGYCFNELKCHRLWLDVFEDNQRAKNLYISEGFKVEGVLRECVFRDNEYKNLMLLSLLEQEYKASHQ